MLDHVKDYYGSTLQNSSDLKTDACCTLTDTPDYIKQVLANIHDEVLMRYYGCGLVVPEALQNLRILDLGSGSGRDVYALSALVGEHGYIVGVDMTNEQLAVANKHIDFHTKQYGYKKANVAFTHGYIEKLNALGFDDNSFDLIISNCVINLSNDKNAVLQQAHRLLKAGGEMYFSDVYADRRIPSELVDNPILYGECLSGALYWNDFLRLAKNNGFTDPRLVEDRPLGIENDEIQTLIGHINFYSATYRLFKLDKLESAHENYGQTVCYQGSIEHHRKQLLLDKQHVFITGKITAVCNNTYRILSESRFKPHFEFHGNTQNHIGIFENGQTSIPFSLTKAAIKNTSSCC